MNMNMMVDGDGDDLYRYSRGKSGIYTSSVPIAPSTPSNYRFGRLGEGRIDPRMCLRYLCEFDSAIRKPFVKMIRTFKSSSINIESS